MAYIEVPESLIGVGKALKKELFQMFRNNLIDHETRINAIALGAAPIVVFNDLILNASSAGSFTGLTFFEASSAFSVSVVKIEIYDKGSITTGTLSVDVKKSTTGLGGTFTSILTTQPSINFATASNYATATGVLSGSQQSIAQGDMLRLDVTALPTTPLGKFRVLVYGNI